MNILDVLGIHVKDIEHAWLEVIAALNKVYLGSKVDDVTDTIERSMPSIFKYDENTNFTNSVISVLFYETGKIIKEEYPTLQPDYYINGYDSHFYINDGGMFEELEHIGVEPDEIKRIIKSDVIEKSALTVDQIAEIAENDRMLDDFIKIFENDNDITIYDSVADLGEDYSDDDCREEFDDDESFGAFLIEGYNDGCSNIFYFEFSDGTAIAGSIG